MKKKLKLSDVTLIAAASTEIDMTQLAMRISFQNIEFGAVKLLSSSLPKKKYSDILDFAKAGEQVKEILK